MPPRSKPIVALLTDFGTVDHYVAAMKAVIAARDPGIPVIDISHEIEPGRVRAAAFTLWAIRDQLPRRTVCIGVVDPGVGTEREIIIAVADGRTYIAPDNGLLDMVLSGSSTVKLFKLSSRKAKGIIASPPSMTFHGRDIFAPVGAHLASGGRPTSVGVAKTFVKPPEWRVLASTSSVQPTVVSVDRFGNIITNVVAPNVAWVRKHVRAVSVGKVMISVTAATFGDAPENAPCLIAGSSGLLEITVQNGNAAQMLRVTDRSAIRIVWMEQEERI